MIVATVETDMTIVDKPRPTNSDLSLDYSKRPLTLQAGDRLTRAEFERRYKALPKIKKAELIEGVVFMPSPVHFHAHSQPHGQIIGWLFPYSAATPKVLIGDNATLRLDTENEVQPDAALFIKGGKCKISDDDYLEGAPELIVEIAASSVSYDLYDKLKIYRRNGVQEYVVWQVNDKRVDWFELNEGQYLPLTPDANGIIKSKVFPGLNLAVNDLLEGSMENVLAELQKGLASEEHIKFVERVKGN